MRRITHLGYCKKDPLGHLNGNSLNGYTFKKLKDTHGKVDLQTPLDRNFSFDLEVFQHVP